MKIIRFKNPILETNHSGNLCIELTGDGNWESFPAFAIKYCKQINATILQKTDGPDVRIWDIEIDGIKISISYDDYPNGILLESWDEKGNEIIKKLFKQIEAEKSKKGV